MPLLRTLALLMTLQIGTCAVDSIFSLALDPDIQSFIQNHSSGTHDEIRDPYSNADVASGFLYEIVNRELRQWKQRLSLAEWNYSTNITNFNMQELVSAKANFSSWYFRNLREARRYNTANMPPEVSRQLRMFTLSATSSDSTLSQESSQLQTSMIGHFSSALGCLNDGSCLPLESSLKSIMATSRDPQVLLDVWTKWRAASGRPMKSSYTRLIQLLNSAAVENGFHDYSIYEQESTFFETPDLDSMQRDLWHDIKPLYIHLHAYVRRKLRETYGSDAIGSDGTIPAHLLGDMWAQHWSEILDIVKPFPEVEGQNQTDQRLKSHASVRDMFVVAEDYFRSLGLPALPSAFWQNSVLVRPLDRDVVCHASSMDMFSSMFSPKDVRIKMCTQVGLPDYRTVHHEMGHLMYFLAYTDKPTIYRTGGNGAFHEAIGDTIQLSALSSTHLHRMGLLGDEEVTSHNSGLHNRNPAGHDNNHRGTTLTSQQTNVLSRNEKRTINTLLATALEKVAFHPFAYLLGLWRNEVIRGQTGPHRYNRRWWELRLKHQGIKAPLPRSEADFDPGAKFHVMANVPYASYFLSYVLQFQMLEALCSGNEMDQSRPLHQCDLYGSYQAGLKLKRLLSYGSSIPWQTQLQEMTGQSTVSAQSLLRYFRPLLNWLVLENQRHGEKLGWQGATINWRE